MRDYEKHEYASGLVSISILGIAILVIMVLMGILFGNALIGLALGLAFDLIGALFLLVVYPPKFLVDAVYKFLFEKKGSDK